MFTPFAFIKRQVSAAIAAIGQRILLIGNFTAFNPVIKTLGVRILSSSSQLDTTFNVGTGSNGVILDSKFDQSGKLLIAGAFTTYSSSAANRIERINTDGTIDATFIQGTGFDNTAYTTLPLTDGKILVGGAFTSYSGSAIKRIARLNSDGTLDSTFSNPYINDGFVKTIATQSDGKIVIGGQFGSDVNNGREFLNKTTPENLIDNTTFNQGVGPDNAVYNFATQSDGKIIMGGAFTNYSGSNQIYLTRINPDGTRDFTYIGPTINGVVYTTKIQPDGKILAGGNLTSVSFQPYRYLGRINTNGTVDTDFKNPELSSTVRSVDIQSDGKIIVGGQFLTINHSSNQYISKIDSKLRFDPTFNTGGTTSNTVYTIAQQSDGKILLGGVFLSYSGSTANRIIRINPDGTRDASFNIGTGFGNGQVEIIRVQPDGKILVGGTWTSTYSGSTSPRFIRLNENGTRDTTFTNGTSYSNGQVNDIQIQSNGQIIVVGSFTGTYNGTSQRIISRINSNGTLDTTFNVPGSSAFSATQYNCAIQSDGKIVVVGINATYNGAAGTRIRRLNTNGTNDGTFAPVVGNTIYRVKIQPNQKILILGTFSTFTGAPTGTVNRIMRINADGTRDTTFNSGTGFDTVAQTNSALELDSSGNIYVGSNFLTYNNTSVQYFVRLNPSGSILAGDVPIVGYDGPVTCLLVDSSLNVYAGGAYASYQYYTRYLVRLNTDGTRDYSFNPGLGFNANVNSVKVQSDDKILVGGQFTTYSGSSNNAMVRLNTDGTRDTSFNIGSGFSGFNGYVYTTKIQPNGKILVHGNFTTYSGSSNNGIVRLNTDGTRDTTFNSGQGFLLAGSANAGTWPSAIELDSSGSIYIGSAFDTYNGTRVNNFVKISPSGSIITGSRVYSGYNNFVHALVVDSTQSVLAGGLFTGYPLATVNIARLDSNGAFDDTFNAGAGAGTNNTQINDIKIQSDNKIVIGGNFSAYSGSNRNLLARINSDGTLDTSFNSLNQYTGAVYKLALESTGKILALGVFYDNLSYSGYQNFYRLNANGTPDYANMKTIWRYWTQNTFSPKLDRSQLLVDSSGNIHITTDNNATVYYTKLLLSGDRDFNASNITISGLPTSLAIDSSDNVTLLGTGSFSAFRNTSRGIIAFENSSNNTSSLFNPGERFVQTTTGQSSTIPSVSVKTTSGDIWLNSGTTQQYYSGSSFSSDLFKISQQGNLLATSSLTYNSVQTLTAQSDGQILAGYASPGYPITNPWRFNSNGTFNTGGQYLWYNIYSMQVQSTGKVLIGGDFYWNEVITGDDGEGGTYSYDQPTNPRYLVRLNPGLGYDYTFLVDQINGPVYNINTLPDDSSILTGFFQLYTGAEKENIAKIDANGNLDYTYIVGPGFSAPVYKTALQPDNKLIAAGNFTQYSGSSGVNRLVRLNTNGSIDTTFNPGSGFNNFNSLSSKILVDNLGNIHVAGGGFTSYSGSAVSGYVKILPNGNIDLTGTSGSFALNQPTTMELLD